MHTHKILSFKGCVFKSYFKSQIAFCYCDKILFMQDGEIKASLKREQESKQEFFTRILDTIARITGGVPYVS